MIRQCTPKCSSTAHSQDAIHGKSNRVHNEVPLKNGGVEQRCTVCGTSVTVGSTSKKEAKKGEEATAS